MIRKATDKDGRTVYRVLSEGGRKMGDYPTMKAARKRLAQVEMFKAIRRRASRR